MVKGEGGGQTAEGKGFRVKIHSAVTSPKGILNNKKTIATGAVNCQHLNEKVEPNESRASFSGTQRPPKPCLTHNVGLNATLILN